MENREDINLGYYNVLKKELGDRPLGKIRTAARKRGIREKGFKKRKSWKQK